MILTWSEVIRNCKTKMGFPHHFIEFEDSEIEQYLKDQCIRKFSTYFPDKWQACFNANDPILKVPNRQDLLYINEPDDKEILSIDNFITSGQDLFATGHPYAPNFSQSGTPGYLLDSFNANNFKQFSHFNYTIKFLPPNMLRILPQYRGRFVIEYSRTHSEDLSTIQGDLSQYFKDLCYAELLMWIGTIRKTHTGIQTPFGEVPLAGDDLYTRGETLHQQLVDKFESMSAPYISMDIG